MLTDMVGLLLEILRQEGKVVLDAHRHGGPFCGKFLDKRVKCSWMPHRHGGPFCGNFLDKRVKLSWMPHRHGGPF